MHGITKHPSMNVITREKIELKPRHSPEFYDGTISIKKDGSCTVTSDSDIQGIAPGQFAIIYSPDRRLCLGSGMISVPATSRRHKKISTAHSKEALNDNGKI